MLAGQARLRVVQAQIEGSQGLVRGAARSGQVGAEAVEGFGVAAPVVGQQLFGLFPEMVGIGTGGNCLLYTSQSPRDRG